MNLTKAHRAQNLKAWKALGPGLIERPLKRIHEAFPDKRNNQGQTIGHHPVYAEALRAAHRGDGAAVKWMAR